jgi:hypothetical protein
LTVLQLQVTTFEKQLEIESHLWFDKTKSTQGIFFFTEDTVTAPMYLNMLEEFPMSVFEEEGPYYMLLKQDRETQHFHELVTDF